MSAPVVKSPEKFKQEVYDLVKDEYTLLTDYQRSAIKVRFKHNVCGNEYDVTPNSFLRGRRCPFCNGNKAKHKTTAQFKQEVFNLVGDEYTVLGEYVNRSTNILIRHNPCGREYNVEPGNFLYRSRCIECYYDSMRITESEARKRILKHLGSLYELVYYPKDILGMTKIKHLKCGCVFEVRLDDVVQKHSGCPHCAQSRGEDYIEAYLKNKGIAYSTQKRFAGLRDKNSLSFDFYLPNLSVLIEYQGEQHFIPKTFGGMSKKQASDSFKLQQKHDDLKRKFASDNHFVILEPSFKLDDYEKVTRFLDSKLLEVTQGDHSQNCG